MQHLVVLRTALLAFVPLAVLPGPSVAAPQAPIDSPVSARLFADGSVECTGADDLSEPVGTALLRPTELGIGFRVVLTQAAPNWTYFVELSQDGDCSAAQKFFGLKTDIDGQGVLEGVYLAFAGSHAILVDVVSDVGGSLPPNPKHREIAPAALMHITLPGSGASTLTLGFDSAPSGTVALPWSEQGFTFTGDGVVADNELGLTAYNQYGGSWYSVTLQRADGGPFDALSFDLLGFGGDGYFWLESDHGEGGYQAMGGNTIALTGPEWQDISFLEIHLFGYYDPSANFGDWMADLWTDRFVVRVPGLR